MSSRTRNKWRRKFSFEIYIDIIIMDEMSISHNFNYINKYSLSLDYTIKVIQ